MRLRVVAFVAAAVALIGGATAAAVVGTRAHGPLPPIKVGVLHSLTGSVAISERPINETTLMAIDEINASGGLLGRKIEPIVMDGRSDWPTFARDARTLILKDHVSVIFGCYTSASRKTILPIVQQYHSALFYPTYYEGMEESPNVVYLGGTPNQNVIPAVQWFLGNIGKRFYLVGSDYVYPRAVNAVVKAQLGYLGGAVVGESYLPLGDMNTMPVVKKILRAHPDAVLSTIVGDTNIPFYADLHKLGVTAAKLPVLMSTVTETDLQSLDPAAMAGDYVAMNYFQSIDSPENNRFVADFKHRYGRDSVVSDQMESAYDSVYLWAEAVRKAGTADPEAVLSAVRGLSFDAPEGEIWVDELSLNTWKTARLGVIEPNGQISVVWQSETVIEPQPYSVYETEQYWQDLLAHLYAMWHDQWSAPEGG
jgi:urea transport system substrate-binding protein